MTQFQSNVGGNKTKKVISCPFDAGKFLSLVKLGPTLS